MPEARKKSPLRLLVPLGVLMLGIGLFYLIATSNSRKAPPRPAPPPPAAAAEVAKPAPTEPPTPAAPAAEPAPVAADPGAPAPQAAQPEPVAAPPTAPPRALSARRFPAEAAPPIGGLTPASEGGQFRMRLEFSPFGAGLHRLTLADYFEHIDRADHETIQRFYSLGGSDRVGATPFAAGSVTIDGVAVDLSLDTRDPGVTLWRPTGPGAFEAVIVERADDGTEREVARLTRAYRLAPNSHEFTIDQRLENLSGRELSIVWSQYGPADLPQGVLRYGGDVRRVRFGYLPPPNINDVRDVLAKEYRISHDAALGKPSYGPGGRFYPIKQLWPDEHAIKENYAIAWAAMTSRYFAVAVHPPLPAGADPSQPRGVEKAFPLLSRVERLALPIPGPDERAGAMILRATSPAFTVAPGATQDLSMVVYAGPLSRRFIAAEPAAAFYNLPALVIFTFGGPCAPCTFQPVAYFLRWFLGTLHDYVVFDWALAIIVLVVCVRGVLHPVTRWSQLSMLRFGKQMQALAPKQKAIQEKYRNDPAKMREEITRLMKEEHVDYGAAARGCLPPFLQMPIWIALYAMIYFTFELRHQAAFFGLFQAVSGGRWMFLGDLAEPDNFINFHQAFGWSKDGFHVPLLSTMMGGIQGLNILPLLLGVVFYIQQKYMTPPSATPLTPEQQQQKKIMKVMMVVMFPLFMYNAPAGLSLYFMINSTLGILESKWIRAHADELEKRREAHAAAAAASGKPAHDRKGKAAPSRPGFFARLQAEVERRQKLIEEQKRQAEKKNRRK
jgi:YidC/Oxa1 family membrane protein insertase